ncbi:hypothetical protein Acsp05_70110 [Actinokineospora sp. NBRC 105648]|nr:hypothetical protein Acsp05_70110 [Actinokineospora sp. NBRC 105648]
MCLSRRERCLDKHIQPVFLAAYGMQGGVWSRGWPALPGCGGAGGEPVREPVEGVWWGAAGVVGPLVWWVSLVR